MVGGVTDMAKTTEERFWEKALVDVNTRCHEWTAYRDRLGYGRFQYEGKLRNAHRMAWYLTYGQWPVHTLDHLCRNRACVNPDHLEDVPHAENIRRGEAGKYLADRTHCGNGHEYTPENTYLYRGRRDCRICKLERNRKSQLKAMDDS